MEPTFSQMFILVYSMRNHAELHGCHCGCGTDRVYIYPKPRVFTDYPQNQFRLLKNVTKPTS